MLNSTTRGAVPESMSIENEAIGGSGGMGVGAGIGVDVGVAVGSTVFRGVGASGVMVGTGSDAAD